MFRVALGDRDHETALLLTFGRFSISGRELPPQVGLPDASQVQIGELTSGLLSDPISDGGVPAPVVTDAFPDPVEFQANALAQKLAHGTLAQGHV